MCFILQLSLTKMLLFVKKTVLIRSYPQIWPLMHSDLLDEKRSSQPLHGVIR